MFSSLSDVGVEVLIIHDLEFMTVRSLQTVPSNYLSSQRNCAFAIDIGETRQLLVHRLTSLE